jgi:hypothetical protein
VPAGIVLFGATGYTGRLTAAALREAGAKPVLAARNPRTLAVLAEELGGGLETAVADVADPPSVRALLEPGDVMVSTVGPFARWGAPAIEAAIDVPFLHVVDIVADEAARIGVTRVGLLGTRFTMCEPFYVEALAARGIDAVVPDCGVEVTELNRIIFDELVHGSIVEESRERYCRSMANLVERGAEAIVLGCTEIMLLVGACDATVPVIDTTEAQARAAVEFALA